MFKDHKCVNLASGRIIGWVTLGTNQSDLFIYCQRIDFDPCKSLPDKLPYVYFHILFDIKRLLVTTGKCPWRSLEVMWH